MNSISIREAKSLDLQLWIFDCVERGLSSCLQGYDEMIQRFKMPRYCVLNKVDLIRKPALLPLINLFHRTGWFEEIFPISARTGDGVEELIQEVDHRLAESEPLFPLDAVTDRSEQFIVSELVREKIYELTCQEVPYSAYVEIESWVTGSKPTIHATIHVDSQSRKVILVGRGGARIKEIGMRARKDIEQLLGYPICLKLFVRVVEGWKKDRRVVEKYLEPAATDLTEEGAQRAFEEIVSGYPDHFLPRWGETTNLAVGLRKLDSSFVGSSNRPIRTREGRM